jgi:predicted amidohydrolase
MDMHDLRITLIQPDLVWEDAAANRDALQQLLAPLGGQTDLIILPEMFTTGFTLAGERLAETMSGPTVQWLNGLAGKLDAAVCGSIIISEQSLLYNRFLCALPSGKSRCYDKRHLFRYAKENSVYTAGKDKLVIDLKGWKIRPFICYDLRFPVWSANFNAEYDLGIYVANWPRARAEHWRALLAARAIENQIYVAGVNRVGIDGNGLEYDGGSTLHDPEGRVIERCGSARQCVTSTLSRAALEDYRMRFPAWKDFT